MRNFVGVLTIALALVVAAGVVAAQQSGSNSVPPPWAFGFATPLTPGAAAPPPPAAPAAPPAPDPTMHKLPGSQFSFTLNQIRDQYGPADWFPGDHPQMPDVVAHGKRDQMVAACSLCHYPNGKGRPENAGVSGLPYSYFVQTMMDFKNDKRKSSDTRKANSGARGSALSRPIQCRRRASPEGCSWLKKEPRPARSRLDCALLKRRRKLRTRKCCVIRIPALSHTCLPAASRKGKPLSPTVPARRHNAPFVTERTCRDSARFPESPAVRPAISSASFMTCR